MQLGIHLSAEEHGPDRLVATARHAEELGFGFATISDHFHPWLEAQGESPFVWTVLGSLAYATERMTFTTAVTCPTIRTHPAVVAHAAATTAASMPGRFILGLGSGENLNEHVVGSRWPAPRERLEMLEEAAEVIRRLLTGELVSHRGRHYRVEDAQLFTRAPQPPPIHVAAGGPTAASLAGRLADGLIIDNPDSEDVIQRFRDERGGDGPVTGKLMLCWAEDPAEARRTALEWWPIGGIGTAGGDLRLPSDFASVSQNLSDEAKVAGDLITDDVDEIAERLEAFRDVGATHVALHQVGPDQDGFLDGPGRALLERYRG
jgi:coenzyme F420-dependent glucose-6-phosphate dehydrogenase